MSDTPRTDALIAEARDCGEFVDEEAFGLLARALERELAEQETLLHKASAELERGAVEMRKARQTINLLAAERDVALGRQRQAEVDRTVAQRESEDARCSLALTMSSLLAILKSLPPEHRKMMAVNNKPDTIHCGRNHCPLVGSNF